MGPLTLPMWLSGVRVHTNVEACAGAGYRSEKAISPDRTPEGEGASVAQGLVRTVWFFAAVDLSLWPSGAHEIRCEAHAVHPFWATFFFPRASVLVSYKHRGSVVGPAAFVCRLSLSLNAERRLVAVGQRDHKLFLA